MKTEDILLIGGLGIGTWYLFSKKAEAQPAIEGLLGGGGGGGGFDLSSLLAGINLGQAKIPQVGGGLMPNFTFNLGGLGQGDLGLGGLGGGLDMSALLAGWGDMLKGWTAGWNETLKGWTAGWNETLKNLNLGGLGGAGGTDITDAIKKAIEDATKSWTAPWGSITDPLHQANVNLAETGKNITGAIGAITAVGRTAVGGFTNPLTGQAPWYSYLFGPVGMVIGGMWKEAGEIVSEKNAAKGTVTLGPEALKTIEQYGGRAAVAEAAQQLAIAQQKAMTPQKQAAAQEVNLGKTTEGPSGLYSGYAQPAAVQKAKTINQQPTIISQKVNYVEFGYA